VCSYLLNIGIAIGNANKTKTEIIEVVLNKASDNNDDHFEVCNRKIDSLLQKIDTA
jgi:hypothetical protein